MTKVFGDDVFWSQSPMVTKLLVTKLLVTTLLVTIRYTIRVLAAAMSFSALTDPKSGK